LAPIEPSLTAALNGSTGNETVIIIRMKNLLSPIGENLKAL
jgi:hypothetical protein